MAADMKCMHIKIYVHHMEIEEMFDFINGRIATPPNYWINPKELPGSVVGGFLEVYISYDVYDRLRTVKLHSSWSDL